jgi:hypothetical protein
MTDMLIDMLIARRTIDELDLAVVLLCRDVYVCGAAGRSGTYFPLK